MSTAAENRFFAGDRCHRCGGYGHWADDGECPWLRKAATPKEHQARIDNLKMRFLGEEIGPYLKREYIRFENKLWKAGST